jgi:hypothetical protein
VSSALNVLTKLINQSFSNICEFRVLVYGAKDQQRPNLVLARASAAPDAE